MSARHEAFDEYCRDGAWVQRAGKAAAALEEEMESATLSEGERGVCRAFEGRGNKYFSESRRTTVSFLNGRAKERLGTLMVSI